MPRQLILACEDCSKPLGTRTLEDGQQSPEERGIGSGMVCSHCAQAREVARAALQPTGGTAFYSEGGIEYLLATAGDKVGVVMMAHGTSVPVGAYGKDDSMGALPKGLQIAIRELGAW